MPVTSIGSFTKIGLPFWCPLLHPWGGTQSMRIFSFSKSGQNTGVKRGLENPQTGCLQTTNHWWLMFPCFFSHDFSHENCHLWWILPCWMMLDYVDWWWPRPPSRACGWCHSDHRLKGRNATSERSGWNNKGLEYLPSGQRLHNSAKSPCY